MTAFAVIDDYRRGKTALFLIACGWAGAAPHWVETGRSLLPAITLAVFLGGYGLRAVLQERKKGSQNPDKIDLSLSDPKEWPMVDIVVAARDEEAVIKSLVKRLNLISYPKENLSIWIVDDGSKDKTPVLLDQLVNQFPKLNVIHRKFGAGGGKSGALNQALREVNGKWLLILDADAQLQDDLLKRVVSFAEQGNWSAIQLRKAVINSEKNPLTRMQAMEMAMDAVIQQGRLTSGGVVELRGNGQLLLRQALEKCGGFNEDTVTDDLDLSFRFLVTGSLVGMLWNPPVKEEAVQTLPALWRQRQRWAEGGLQRFFDYWSILISNKLTLAQRYDLSCFFLLQYALPVVTMFDLMTAIATRTIPAYFPLSIVALSVSGLAFWRGCRKVSEGPQLPVASPLTVLFAILYLAHWFIVIPWVTIRMAIFPKRLFWAKTNHLGVEAL
ncbi:glycosyltransferase family 2 protein [Prochlorococcus sp. MIT 1341]|uniref:glycosyltransferase n=1 Tax=Prochlorococcus sp. MIT 1341 TaxID=3096221 RepID=UPI002A756D88|nr:glycosyltransferase family 2 protein [Prochlorococcus sp. MIT 1341]